MHEIAEALHEGRPFSYINICVLAFALAIVGERTWYILTRYRLNANDFMFQIRNFVKSGQIDQAIALCDSAPLPLLQVIKSGLTQVDKGDDAVIASIEETMTEVVPALEKRTPALWTLANIATLLGLLGTIRGLIKAFGAVGEIDDAAQKTAILASGISEAMWNTFLGLLIAVICMVTHMTLNGMTKRHKHDLEKSVMRLENLLTLEREQS